MAEFTAPIEDRSSLTIRLVVLQVGCAVVFTILAFSFWYFQVVQGEKFRELAENNHQRTIPLRAPRGVMLDRNGAVLVENRSSFTISIVREQTTDLDRTIRTLSDVAGLDPKYVQDVMSRHRREPTYRPIVIVEDASIPQVAAVLARRSEMPDVQVDEVPTRQYPADSFAAHLFGYVGEASEGQVVADGLHNGAIVGQAGVEKIYNKLLMGVDGAKVVRVNSLGREIDTVGEHRGHPGAPRPTDDRHRSAARRRRGIQGRRLQWRRGRDGSENRRSARVHEPPGYNPNDFAAGVDHATWSGLITDPLKPLQNRATQGLYSPGSTFKIVVAVAALEEGVINSDFRVSCRGSAVFFGRPFQCWKKGGHGSVDLRHAMEQSCNVYYYTIGNMVGVDRMHKWATLLGLGEKTGIDLPNEIEGLVPSTEWKRRRYNEKWYAGRDHFRVHRTGSGVADAGVTSGHDVDGGERRHALRSSSAEGDRRRQRVEARAASRAEVAGAAEARNNRRASRRVISRRQWRRYRRARAHSRQGRFGKDRHRTGDFTAGRKEGGRTHRAGPARPRMVRLLRAA